MNKKRNYLIKESLRRKIFSRWFLVINIVIFLLLFVSFHLDTIINFFGGDFKDEKKIMIVDNVNYYNDFKKEFLRIANIQLSDYKFSEINNIDDLKEEVKKDSNVIGIELIKDSDNFVKANIYTYQGLSGLNKNIIFGALNNVKKDRALKSFGITSKELEKVEEEVKLNTVVLSEKSVNDNKNVSASILVIVFVVPCFFLITTLIQMIGSEINEEKTTKSMEIIISNVPAKDHLIAKIVSCTIFTFIQTLLILAFTFISAITHSGAVGNLSKATTEGFSSAIFGDLVSQNFINMAATILPILLISFIITLITYALIAGVLSSMTTNIDDFQQLQTPIMLIVSSSFYIALMAALFEGSVFIKIMAFIPLISFMVFPTLFMLNQISIVSVIISVIIQFLFLILVYHYGIKIYRVGLLNYSGEHLWRKIIKALRTNKTT